jgi:small membrane protein
MKPVQLLLGLGTAFLLLVYLTRFRSKLSDRLVGLALLGLAWFSILLPDYATRLANLLGVGRGADLIFYFFGLFTMFALIMLNTQLRRQHSQITRLVRHLALRDAVLASDLDRAEPPLPESPTREG